MRCESGWTGDRCTFDLHHEGLHSNEPPEKCDSCGGRFNTTMDPRVEAECDSQLQDPGEFTPGPIDQTFCENDGWMKIEHDLGRNVYVHESCFLDHDDILVRV